jgi:FixJ family two-component response regulator
MTLPIIHVVDDDPSFRTAVTRLLRAAKYEVRGYGSASEFLASDPCADPGCILLDLQMPGVGGFDLQQSLARMEERLPIIFLTGHGDIPASVRAMKGGAVDFLTKPVRREALLGAVENALAIDAKGRAARAALREIHDRYENLTPREREVLMHVVSGKLNKQIALIWAQASVPSRPTEPALWRSSACSPLLSLCASPRNWASSRYVNKADKKVSGVGFQVSGSKKVGFRFQCSGFRVSSTECRVSRGREEQ